MEPIASAAALLLATVFVWSAVAKFRSPGSTERLLITLGAPLPRPTARALPMLEVALAAGLVFFQRPAGFTAVIVLIGFSAVLATIIRRGLEIGCGCFGSTSTEPVSTADLIRNGGLIGLAVLAAMGPSFVRPTLPALMIVSTSGLLVLITMALVGLRRSAGSVFGIELAGEVGRMRGSR